MILLDTDILSELMKQRASSLLVARLVSVRQEEIFISAMTQSEILYGLRVMPEGAKKHRLAERIAAMLEIYADRCLRFDIGTASVLAQIRAQGKKRGKIVPLADAIIASTAIQHDLTLMTRNLRHFKDIERLRLSDPMAGEAGP